jgi:hydroxymethylpyrimidine/phosphomethylpyrimidine kinase
LTIAGSDPSGGAGLQADLKTFHRFGVYGEAVCTLITVQNSLGVSHIEVLAPELIGEQIAAVLEDIPPAAVKTGALGSAETVRAVSRAAAEWRFPMVVDPVVLSTSGSPLLSEDGVRVLCQELLPLARLVTPNLAEAALLAGIPVRTPAEMRMAGCKIRALGPRAVLIKGGHLEGDATDLLFDGAEWREFSAPRIPARHTHGTGCAYSAAITAALARGEPLSAAVTRAKAWIQQAIRTSPGLGRGSGPLNFHAEEP